MAMNKTAEDKTAITTNIISSFLMEIPCSLRNANDFILLYSELIYPKPLLKTQEPLQNTGVLRSNWRIPLQYSTLS